MYRQMNSPGIAGVFRCSGVWSASWAAVFPLAAFLLTTVFAVDSVAVHPDDQHVHPDDQHDHLDPSDRPPAVSLVFESSQHTIPAAGSEFFLRVRLTAGTSDSDVRQPINLSVVFDRSGSMKEESKIGYLRQAGHLVADNLMRDDHAAFVAYNHQVKVLVPMHQVVNREYLHHRIDELRADGHTNLSGGLLEGCAQLQDRLDKPGHHHVILLTDGLANRGVIDTPSLVQIGKQCADRGITVTTIGVGTGYNEDLLSQLAQAGNGRFVHVSEPDNIPTALEQEMGALATVVAQNVTLRMPLPADVEAVQVFGREEPMKPGVVEVRLGDLTSEEDYVVLIKFRATAQPSSAIELPMTLSYDDVATAQRMNTTQTIVLEVAENGVAIDDRDPVLAYARVVESVDKVALAVRSMDRDLAKEVLQIRDRDYPLWKQVAIDSRDQDAYNKAFMFEHYARELQHMIDIGALHDHSQVRAQLQKELHYRQYMMHHHGHQH